MPQRLPQAGEVWHYEPSYSPSSGWDYLVVSVHGDHCILREVSDPPSTGGFSYAMARFTDSSLKWSFIRRELVPGIKLVEWV